MNDAIQLHSIYVAAPYVQDQKSNEYMGVLDKGQDTERQKLSPAASFDDAASIEISNAARAKYESSSIVSHTRKAAEDNITKEYMQALSNAADGFADFSEKVTKGAYKGYEFKKYVGGYYRSHDVSASDMNLDVIDQMESIYQSYKGQIESSYEGDERDGQLAKLDDAYHTVFTNKIINPVRDAYDAKLDFFHPDSEDTTSTLQGVFGSVESFQSYISNYMTNQAINRQQTAILKNGTKAFYDMAENTSLWHDSATVKKILKESMDIYSSVKEIPHHSDAYRSAKASADEIAKRISDMYAQNLNEHKVEIKDEKEGEKDTKWDEFLSNSNIKIQGKMVNASFRFGDLIKLIPDQPELEQKVWE